VSNILIAKKTKNCKYFFIQIYFRNDPDILASKGRPKKKEREKVLSEKIAESASKKRVQTTTSSKRKISVNRKIEKNHQDEVSNVLNQINFSRGKSGIKLRPQKKSRSDCFSKSRLNNGFNF